MEDGAGKAAQMIRCLHKTQGSISRHISMWCCMPAVTTLKARGIRISLHSMFEATLGYERDFAQIINQITGNNQNIHSSTMN